MSGSCTSGLARFSTPVAKFTTEACPSDQKHVAPLKYEVFLTRTHGALSLHVVQSPASCRTRCSSQHRWVVRGRSSTSLPTRALALLKPPRDGSANCLFSRVEQTTTRVTNSSSFFRSWHTPNHRPSLRRCRGTGPPCIVMASADTTIVGGGFEISVRERRTLNRSTTARLP